MNIDRILTVESGNNPYASNPRSTALGTGQFLSSTWLDMMAKNRPDLTVGKSQEEILALRTDPDLSKAMTAAYASQNAGTLTKAGLPVTPGTTYLAHFAGPQGAVNVLKSDPNAPVGSVLGESVIKANPFLAKMTIGDLRAWADRKMGSPTVTAQAQPSMPQMAQQMAPQQMPQMSPMQSAPQQQMPQISPQMFMPPEPPPMAMPPPAQPRPRIDPAALRAAFLMRKRYG